MIVYGGVLCACGKRSWYQGAVRTIWKQGFYEPVEHFVDVVCRRCGYRGPGLVDTVLYWEKAHAARKRCTTRETT